MSRKKSKKDKRRIPVTKTGAMGNKTVLHRPNFTSLDQIERASQKRTNRIKKQGVKAKTSAGERQIIIFLKGASVLFEREFEFKDCFNPHTGFPYRFDFYIRSINACIEFDGMQHFKPSKALHGKDAEVMFARQQFNDRMKNQYCAKNGIRLLRIPYYEYSRINQILTKFFDKVETKK